LINSKSSGSQVAHKTDATFTDPQLKLHLDYLENELGKSTWFAGNELSAADIQMSFPLEAAGSRVGITPLAYPRLHRFITEIQSRPAYQVALQKGGLYAYAAPTGAT